VLSAAPAQFAAGLHEIVSASFSADIAGKMRKPKFARSAILQFEGANLHRLKKTGIHELAKSGSDRGLSHPQHLGKEPRRHRDLSIVVPVVEVEGLEKDYARDRAQAFPSLRGHYVLGHFKPRWFLVATPGLVLEVCHFGTSRRSAAVNCRKTIQKSLEIVCEDNRTAPAFAGFQVANPDHLENERATETGGLCGLLGRHRKVGRLRFHFSLLRSGVADDREAV